MGAKESGQAFLETVLAKLPAEKQAAAKAIFEDAGAEAAVVLLGDGALARADYSKGMDGVRAKTDELEGWFRDNKAALDDYLAIKPEYDRLKTTTTTTTTTQPPPLDDKAARKVAEDLLAEQGPHFLQASAWLAAKAIEHKDLFGEALDVMALASDPRLGRQIKGQPEGCVCSLPDLYSEKFGEKVAAKQKDAEEKRINDLVEAKFKDRVAQSTTNPFPLRGEASVLDVLADKDGSAKHTLDTATALYERLQGERG
jgi:hypothetical protein